MKHGFTVEITNEFDETTSKNFSDKDWSRAIAYVTEQFIREGEKNGHSHKLTISMEAF